MKTCSLNAIVTIIKAKTSSKLVKRALAGYETDGTASNHSFMLKDKVRSFAKLPVSYLSKEEAILLCIHYMYFHNTSETYTRISSMGEKIDDRNISRAKIYIKEAKRLAPQCEKVSIVATTMILEDLASSNRNLMENDSWNKKIKETVINKSLEIEITYLLMAEIAKDKDDFKEAIMLYKRALKISKNKGRVAKRIITLFEELDQPNCATFYHQKYKNQGYIQQLAA
ncbi:MAG: hypothetical protein KAG61_05005 [Bacteriovoracaceae bacterium]|nr:hypothetical protein [Bacteriovoracaceae bacterium]